MFVMTYSQARQNLSSFLDRAKIDGEAIINRADGTQFRVTPIIKEDFSDSPLYGLYNFSKTIDEPFQKLSIEELIETLQEDREERADKITNAARGKTASCFFNTFNK